VAAARELPQLSLLDALELTTLIARKDSGPGDGSYGLTVNGRIMSLSSCSTMWQWYT
jgi:hypothetical protein